VIHYAAMAVDVEADCFTVGVFQDLGWAQPGLDALRRAGLPAETITILAKDSPDVAAFIDRNLGAGAERLEIANLGATLMKGPLVAALQGPSRDLASLGLAGTMRRIGFQSHDGRIYDTLTTRGGILVAIQSQSRASDALAILLSFGGGNAAIGAWTGRV
jgi:hypothetical protein